MKIITEKFALLVGFLITLTLLVGGFNICGIALFKWVLLVLCYLCGISTRCVRLKKYNRAFLVLIISIAISIIGAANTGYIEVSFIVGNFVNIILITITVKMMESAGDSVMLSFVRGIELSCYFQGIYCALQYLFRSVMDYSLNRFIFDDILHINDEAALRDIINEGVFVEYGMNSHPSVLIPIIIIMMCFGKNKTMSITLSIIIVVLSRNSTTAIAFVLCLIMPLIIQVMENIVEKRKSKFNNKKFLKVFLGIAACIVILFTSGWYLKLFEVMNRTWVRIIGNSAASDYSTRTHTLYYTSIIIILSRMNLFNVIFGNGFNSSGDVATHMGIIINDAKNWAIEADPVDLLYGIGIFGIIVFYYWFLRSIRRAYKWGNEYMVFAITILVCGITYRIQYLWVIMFELVLFRLISKNIDITKMESNSRMFLGDRRKRYE